MGKKAGINVTLLISLYAYVFKGGERRASAGADSPFDSKAPTCLFASVDVTPQIEGEIDIKIEEED